MGTSPVLVSKVSVSHRNFIIDKIWLENVIIAFQYILLDS